MTLRWLLLSLLASLALALPDIRFTNPKGGELYRGGDELKASWQFSGNDTYVPAKTTYNLYLCAGGNQDEAYERLMTIVEGGKLADVSRSASATVSPGIGQDHENAYFLQMVINTPINPTIVHSDRFGFEGMAGRFPQRVADFLFHLHPTVTLAPTVPINVQAILKRQAGEPYAEQTGATKYAPAPKQPGTKITKKSVKPQYSTSSYKVATTFLDSASVKTTVSASATYSTKSIENTAKGAGKPTDGPKSNAKRDPEDEWSKYLRRWEDAAL